MMSLPVSHAILPHAVWFATSRLANHAICSFIDSLHYVICNSLVVCRVYCMASCDNDK